MEPGCRVSKMIYLCDLPIVIPKHIYIYILDTTYVAFCLFAGKGMHRVIIRTSTDPWDHGMCQYQKNYGYDNTI